MEVRLIDRQDGGILAEHSCHLHTQAVKWARMRMSSGREPWLLQYLRGPGWVTWMSSTGYVDPDAADGVPATSDARGTTM